MHLQTLTPILWVEDLSATVNFYTGNLGFLLDNQSDDGEWAQLHRDNVAIMFSKPNKQMVYDGPRLTGTLYLRTDDVEAWWKQLKDIVPVLYPLESFRYGMREFAIYDCNGYVIQFGQETAP